MLLKRCPKCYGFIIGELEYCPYCNSKLPRNLSPDDSTSAKSESRSTSKILISLIAILGFTIAGYFGLGLFSPGSGGDQYTQNLHIVEQIARDYNAKHGGTNEEFQDLSRSVEMAKDVWAIVKGHGINAAISLGDVNKKISQLFDANHAWVLAECGPDRWAAIETTGGYIVYKKDNPLYYEGFQFETPSQLDDYQCGQSYCPPSLCKMGQCPFMNSGRYQYPASPSED